MLLKIISTHFDWTLTIARILLGVVFFAHGAQKLLGWFGGPGFRATMRGMQEHLHLPAILAFIAIATEFFGGAALIVGFFSRIAAVGIGVTMAMAILMVHGRYGLFLNWVGDREGHGFEYHLLAIALAILIIVRGAGAVSLDGLFYHWIGAEAATHRPHSSHEES
jgi:putative oxidoreductase